MTESYDNSKTIAYAELAIWGAKIRPHEITEILGLVPTFYNEIGDQCKLNGRHYVCATWEFKTEEITLIEDISEPLNDLIAIFQTSINSLVKIKKNYKNCSITIRIVVHNNQEILPGISLTPKQISFLASIGAGIDYDIYQNVYAYVNKGLL